MMLLAGGFSVRLSKRTHSEAKIWKEIARDSRNPDECHLGYPLPSLPDGHCC